MSERKWAAFGVCVAVVMWLALIPMGFAYRDARLRAERYAERIRTLDHRCAGRIEVETGPIRPKECFVGELFNWQDSHGVGLGLFVCEPRNEWHAVLE